MPKGLHHQPERVECDDSSDGNIVLKRPFNFVTPTLENVLRALSLVVSQIIKVQSTKHKARFSNCDECRWNYMPFKHEVPGSSPGGSNNICGAIAQGLEHAFHQLLSSQFFGYVHGLREFHKGSSQPTARLRAVSRCARVGAAASGKRTSPHHSKTLPNLPDPFSLELDWPKWYKQAHPLVLSPKSPRSTNLSPGLEAPNSGFLC